MDAWLESGKEAGMAYMARNREKRRNPELLVEGARSVVVTLTNYYAPALAVSPEVPVVARYAYGRDYHGAVKERLFQLFAFLREREGRPLRGRVFVDSAPVFEREWARRAGLGWIGRNTLLAGKVIAPRLVRTFVKSVGLATHLEHHRVQPVTFESVKIARQCGLHLVARHSFEKTVDGLNPRSAELPFGRDSCLCTACYRPQHTANKNNKAERNRCSTQYLLL